MRKIGVIEMKRISKNRIERLYNYLGIIRFGNIAIIKKCSSYKYMLKQLLWAIVDVPASLILNIIAIFGCLYNLVPSIYVESEVEDE